MTFTLTFNAIPALSQSFNLTVDQGANSLVRFEVLDDNADPIDLSDYSGNAQFRKHYHSNTYIEFAVSIEDNLVMLELDADQTDNVEPGRYLYDVELSANSGQIWRLVEGILTLKPGITR